MNFECFYEFCEILHITVFLKSNYRQLLFVFEWKLLAHENVVW